MVRFILKPVKFKGDKVSLKPAKGNMDKVYLKPVKRWIVGVVWLVLA